MDVGQALTLDWAERRLPDGSRSGRPYARQTVPVLASSFAVASGLAISAAFGGAEALRRCFDLNLIKSFLPVALCFATGLTLKMMAVSHFRAGTIKIVGQLRLPMMAVLSAAFLARAYSSAQWQVIVIITTSCLCFVSLNGQESERRQGGMNLAGSAQLMVWLLLNCAGGIVAESAYKGQGAPFYVQKVAEDLGHLLVGTMMLLLVVPRFRPEEDITDRKVRPGGFFDAWDVRTMLVVAFLVLDAWIGNALVKEFSGVVRSIAKAFGIAVVYFLSLVQGGGAWGGPALTLAALLVIQSSFLFSVMP